MERCYRQLLQQLSPKREDLNLDIMLEEALSKPVWHILHSCLDSYYDNQIQDCLRDAQILLDFAWEKLNTGLWKQVDISWRYLYSYASLFKALSQSCICADFKDVIHTCDMGLLMGAPVLDNILSRIAAMIKPVIQNHNDPKMKLTDFPLLIHKEPMKKRINHGVPVIDKSKEITRLSLPSLQTFQNCFMANKKPVIIENGMKLWPAMNNKRWSLDYLKNVAGCRTVPVELGSKYTDNSWSQRLITLEEFIDDFVVDPDEDTPVGYLAQHQLFDQIPELMEDISVPTYCALGDDEVEINAWFGPKGTVSPLHHDPKHNLLCQVVGEKYVRLYEEKYSPDLYPYSEQLLENTSQVDVEQPDLDKYPNFTSAEYTECVLRPGEMLYIPPRHWHYVRSLAVSFSVSFWWM